MRILRAILLAVSLTIAPSASAVLAAPATDTTVGSVDIDASTIPQLQAHMNARRISSAQLVRFYLRRIDRLNIKLNAVISVNHAALDQARAADLARRRGDRRPLLGIPVIVKDNVNTTGMMTTAGSWALFGSRPNDAFIISKLREAGAIVIAKANLSEWANFRSAVASSGWSGLGGQVNMPYVLDRNPCGSSSGSAVAVAADLATIAIGTETDGSIMCPSGANGIVGVKPTLGLWSRSGIIPISAEQDTAGPMARNVTDAALLLRVLAATDGSDAATLAQVGHVPASYLVGLDTDALDGARIGVWRSGTYDPAVSPEVEALMDTQVEVLEALGATVIDETPIPIEDAYAPEFEALLCEFKSDIASYLTTYTGEDYPKSLEDLIAFNEANPELEGPYDSVIFEIAEETGGRDAACATARASASSLARDAIDATLAADDLDAIIAPTNGPAWVTDPVNGDLGGDFSAFVGSSSPSAISGYPSVTVPAGSFGPLPLGISFIGPRWSEAQLLAYAYAFEQGTRARVPPTYLETYSVGADGPTGGAKTGATAPSTGTGIRRVMVAR